MKAGTNYCCCISKCMTKDALQNHPIYRAKLNVYDVGIFLNISRIHPPSSLRSHLSSSLMGIFLGGYGIIVGSST